MGAFLYMKLKPNKRIGKVLYLVEGDVDEVLILRHIFSDVLHYSVVTYDKRNDNVTYLFNPNDKYSKAFIVPMKYSAISKIEDSVGYVEYIYSKLKGYGLEKDECARYLIFDRDIGSNSYKKFKSLFKTFKNSLDNNLEINGLLLVSYPCVQSLLCECFGDDVNCATSDSMKCYAKKYDVCDIKEKELLTGAESMIKTILRILQEQRFDNSVLDDMEEMNCCILSSQDNYYKQSGAYITLSLVFLSFVDLGIIEL